MAARITSERLRPVAVVFGEGGSAVGGGAEPATGGGEVDGHCHAEDASDRPNVVSSVPSLL